MSAWNALIPDAPFDWALIPLDGHKRPIDPETGELKTDWQQQDGYDVDGISALNGQVHAVGLMLGEKSGGILQVDFDGLPSPAKFQEVYGKSPKDLPRTIGVTSGKESRGSRFFLVDPDWWDSLRGRKSWKDANGEVCLELRWSGHQAVIAGKHPETKGYRWMTNSSPADLEMAMAPDWLLEPLIRTEATYEPVEVSAEDAQRAIAMLQCIDPNSRTDYDGWLEIGMALHHTDPGLLSDWIEWSQQMPNFDEAECLQKWQGFADYKGKPLTIGTLHHYAKKGGYVEPKRQPVTEPQGGVEGDVDKQRKADIKSLADAARRIYLDKEISPTNRLVHLRAVNKDLSLGLRDSELQRFIWDVRRSLAGVIDGYGPDDVIETLDQPWLMDGFVLLGDSSLVVGLPKANKTTFVLAVLGAIYKGEREFLGRSLIGELPPLFIAGPDQPGKMWQQFLVRSGLADTNGKRCPSIVKLYTRERPIHLTPDGIEVMAQEAENHPGMVFLLDSYSTLTRPLQLEEISPAFADPFIDLCEAVAPFNATVICIHHAGKGSIGKSASFASRGSTALPAAASQCVVVAKLNPDDKNDKRRIISTEGRLSEDQKVLATYKGDDGWLMHGDAEQVELAKQLDDAEEKLNDRQFAALGFMRERWELKAEISQADLEDLKEFKGVDRNNRRRALDSLVRKKLAISREVSTDKGRLKLFQPIELDMSHSNDPISLCSQGDSSDLPDSTPLNTGMSHINQMSPLSSKGNSSDTGDSTPSLDSHTDLFWQIVNAHPNAFPSQIANKLHAATGRTISGVQAKALIAQGPPVPQFDDDEEI